MNTKKPTKAQLLLLFGALLVSLLLVELAYRLLQSQQGANAGDDDWYRRYRHMNEMLYRRSSDARLVYEPVPSASVEMEYGAAHFNRASLRDDREREAHAQAGVTRVAMLGDSLVWSEFLALADSLPRQTQRALGTSYEVLNAGVTGYDTSQELVWYQRTVRPLHPDIVVVVYCMNDMLIMSGPYGRFATPEEQAIKDRQDSWFAHVAPLRRETIDQWISDRERHATLRLLARATGVWERSRFEAHYVDEPLLALTQPTRQARTAQALRALGQAIQHDHATAVLLISPMLESWSHYRWRVIHDFVRREAEAGGFRVLDPLDELRRNHRAEEMASGSDNLHYGRRGARILGRWLATKITTANR